MKVNLTIPREVDIKTLHVLAGVRYWEDATVNDEEDTDGQLIPFRDGQLWKPVIDIETGKIQNWPKGVKADVHYKVADCCGWELKDDKGETVLSAEDGYVPETLSPKERGYGDYIIMEIDVNGYIQDWEFSIDDFAEIAE